jgi:hypothetical protein
MSNRRLLPSHFSMEDRQVGARKTPGSTRLNHQSSAGEHVQLRLYYGAEQQCNDALASAIMRVCQPFFCFVMLIVPYAPPADHCHQKPVQRQRANRFALALFTLTLLAGLLVKYSL